MTKKEHRCGFCGEKLENDKPVFGDYFGLLYCSEKCLANRSLNHYYPTLREALEKEKKVPEKVCKVCGKDLTHANGITDHLFVDINEHIFCSLECLAEWNYGFEADSWEQYYQIFFK